jgi:hypothetical protein
MKEFKVEITETLQKTITIIASSESAAIEEAKSLYRDEVVVLDDSNYIDTEYNIVKSEEN